jgi:hypothetical protein
MTLWGVSIVVVGGSGFVMVLRPGWMGVCGSGMKAWLLSTTGKKPGSVKRQEGGVNG